MKIQSPFKNRQNNHGSAVLKTQAERILRKFGGARRLSRIMKLVDPHNGLHHSSIYRWLYPKSRGGTGGIVPSRSMQLVIKSAAYDGIVLTQDDIYPGLVSEIESRWKEQHHGNPDSQRKKNKNE